MKKLLTLAIIMIAVTIVSCKKENPGDGGQPGNNIEIQITGITDTTATSAVCHVSITADNVEIIERGVCWNKSGEPTVSDYYTSKGSGDGGFSLYITELEPTTKYFVRAYAKFKNDVKYSNELEFTTLEVILSREVQTLYMSHITDESAWCHARIVDWKGVDELFSWGCCWSTTPHPDFNDSTNWSGAIIGGEFVTALTELTASTKYYVRAYVENASGFFYGNEIEFVAENEEPHPNPWSPEPVNGQIPVEVLPEALAAEIGQYMNIYSGETPLIIDSLYNSSPHKLFHTTFDEPADTVYHDLRFQFVKKDNKVDLIEWVFDNYAQYYYPIAFRDLYMIGSGNNFTAYYLEEDYSNGKYTKTATILSGTFDEANNAVNDFKIAEILLKTYGNPNLPPENSYRIVGDADGVSEYYPMPY